MEFKKNPAVSIAKERPLFTIIGYIFSFSIVFITLSFTVYDDTLTISDIRPLDDPGLTIINYKVEEDQPKKEPEKETKSIINPEAEPVIDDEAKDKLIQKPEVPETGTGSFNVDSSDKIAEKPELPVDEPINEAMLDAKPEFPGGIELLHNFINEHIIYTHEAVIYGIEGRVSINFIIEKDGSVSNVHINGIPLGFGLDEEAVRVVRLFPKFIPGSIRMRPVRTICNIDINFTLND